MFDIDIVDITLYHWVDTNNMMTIWNERQRADIADSKISWPTLKLVNVCTMEDFEVWYEKEKLMTRKPTVAPTL